MTKITRRDFLNSTLLGAGASLLSANAPLLQAGVQRPIPPGGMPADGWYGYGGVGDYAASHGNTPAVLDAAHALRHNKYVAEINRAQDTGENYDLVIVGAGMAGLGAAYEFATRAPAGARCLILDNHPMFGGEAKRNEFDVGGVRLIAPQGSNGFSMPPRSTGNEPAYAVGDSYYYDRLGVPRDLKYVDGTGGAEDLRFGRDNFSYMHWRQDRIDISYLQGEPGNRQHVLNPWANGLEDLAMSEQARASLIEWQRTDRVTHPKEGLEPWLDSMSMRDYLEKELGLDPAVGDYLDPVIAAAMGSSCEVSSALALYYVSLPGFKGYHDDYTDNRHSFPGGNATFARFFLKKIMPRAIAGTDRFEDIVNGAIDFASLDSPDESVRMRLSSTVVRVQHNTHDPARASAVDVFYTRDGRLQRLRAKAVVMAGGGWINKHVVADLPQERRTAYESFNHAAFLVANVALTNWQFMYKLGVSACRYEGEFGFGCNLRQPMTVGDYQPPHDPGKPAVLTFYVPFYTNGESPAMQGQLGRMKLFGTSYAQYEKQIRAQMNELFASSGFNDQRDIAGIILNRWGHAYYMPEPGTFFGRDGNPPASEILGRRHGLIAFGHGELRGLQHWGPAAADGRRAFNEIAAAIGVA